MNLLHAAGATLLNDLRGKIDFVMRGPDAGAELRDQVGRIRAKARFHLIDGQTRNRQFRSFFAGVYQSDRRCAPIDDVNGAAIGHIDSEENTMLICDEPITTGKRFVAGKWLIDDGNVVPVHLFRGYERQGRQSQLFPNASMHVLELLKRFRLFAINRYSRNTLDECTATNPERIKGRKVLHQVLLGHKNLHFEL